MTAKDMNEPVQDTQMMEYFEQQIKTISIVSPPGLSVTLYPHQCMAITRMEQRESMPQTCQSHYAIQSSVGIYADKAGSGKTLGMLGLLVRDRMEWNLQQDYVHSSILSVYGHGCIVKKSLLYLKRIPSNLIVASHLILLQWIEELKKTTLSFQAILTKRKLDEVDPFAYQVILVVPHCFNELMERFPNYAWKRFIFDEPTHTKISSMRSIVAGFIWFLTATPDLLLYHYRTASNFMSSIFSSSMDYHLYQHLIIKNDGQFISLSYRLPALHHIYHTCYQPIVEIVQHLINENILSMIHAGNIEGAVKALGGQATSNLIDLVRQEKMFQKKECMEKMERFTRFQDTTRFEKWKGRLQQLEKQEQDMMTRYHILLQQNTCHICFEINRQPILLSCCQNLFCGNCVLQWLHQKSTCPLCRRTITPEYMIYIETIDSSSPINDQPLLSLPLRTKLDTILDIFDPTSSTKRCLIFSNFDESFEPICRLLQEYDISYYIVHGRSEQRHKQIHDFKKGIVQVLFLNSMTYGIGMNLQECTDIILYHTMTEDMETQLIGRAYRIGRTEELRIHHFV